MSTAATTHETEARANARMIARLYFRILPIQVVLMVIGAVNGLITSFFAGNYVGEVALSAFGLFGPANQLVTAIGTIMLGGSQVLCARFMGMGRNDEMQSVFTLDLLVMTAVSVTATVILLVLGVFDLTAFAASYPEVRASFNQFLIGIAPNMVPFLVGQQLFAFLAFEQQGKRTTMASIVAIVANAFFNWLFVCMMRLDALGLALATSASNWVFLAMLVPYFLTEQAHLRLTLAHAGFRHLKDVVLIGLPGALVSGYMTLRGLIVNGLVMAHVGAVGLSAFTAANSLLNIFWAVPAGIQATARILFSMYIGEEDRRSLADTMGVCLFRALPIVIVMAAGIILLAVPFSDIFYRDTAQPVFQMTVQAFRILPLCMPLSTICMCFVAYGQSSGKQAVIHVDTVFDGVICVAGFSALLIPAMGIDGLYWANVLNGVVCVAIFLIYAIIANRRLPRSVEELMVIPEGFGAPDTDRLDISIQTMEDVLSTSEKVEAFCRAHGVGDRESYYGALCMEEMAGNIVDHGFAKDRKKHAVDVRVVYKPEMLVLRIKDDCVPFDPAERAKLLDPNDPFRNVGIRLVYQIADRIDHRFTLGLNVLTMFIKLQDADETVNP